MSESLDVKYCSTVRAAELVNDRPAPQPAEPDGATDKPVKYYTAEQWEQKEKADPHVQMLGRVIPHVGGTALWDRGQVLSLMARAAATAAAEASRAMRESASTAVRSAKLAWRCADALAAAADSVAALPLPAGTAERPDVTELVEALRPFAEYADWAGDKWPDDTGLCLWTVDAAQTKHISLAECRAARSALAKYRGGA